MPAPNLLTLFALASIAIVALSSGPLHAHALVADRAQVARHVHAHDAIAKRKRSDSSIPSASGSCIPRPSSSVDSSLPTSTSTSTPAPPPPTSTIPSPAPSPTPSTKKWCVAANDQSPWLDNFLDRPKVAFYYSWSASIPENLASFGVLGMPMLWGDDSTSISQFQQMVVSGYATIAMGFNEPNEPSQSNMTPQQGYDLWMQYILPLKSSGYTLISPACTDDAVGIAWYQEFFQLCNSQCGVDIVAFHSYSTQFQDTVAYASGLYNNYSLPIAITEIADNDFSGNNIQPTMDEVWAFAGQLVQFVDSTEWVAMCCPFGVMEDLQGVDQNNALLDAGTGYPTPLGYTYFG